MKKLLTLILSILLLTGCATAVYDGPTESVWVLAEQHTTHFNAVTGEAQPIIWVHSYDSFGNNVRTCFYSGGELTEEYRHTYDDRGNCIRDVKWLRFWNFSYPSRRTAYTYDDRDRLLTVTYRNGFGIRTGGDTYTYDDAARTETWEGTYDTRTTYLNENGDPVRVVTFSEPAGMEIEALYEYGDEGRYTKVTEYYDGDLGSTSERRCDDRDRPLEYTIYDANGTVILRTNWLYEENTVTSWDQEGNRSVETLRPDGQVEKQEYYDREGNLLSRSEYTYKEIQIPTERRETP